MDDVTTDTVIIGAGPSGLAMAACLTRAKIPHIIIERAEHVGHAWRNHYDRLHLHTVKKYSNLPYLNFPEHVEKYPSRQAVVDYLDTYAQHFKITPRLGNEVTSVRQDNGGWITACAGGEFRSRRVVVSTGYNRRPVLPQWPGMDQFQGTIRHSVDYRNGAYCRGKRVLVVGIGNTGGEIAIDLYEHGASLIHICVRGPVNVIARDFLGSPAQVTGIMLSKLPQKIRYALSKRIAHVATGDLSRYGLKWPDIGPVESVERLGRVSLIDIGTIDLIKRGAIVVKPAIARFAEHGVVFANDQQENYDAVILATGYKPRLDEFLEDAQSLTDNAGYPVPPAGASNRSGLYFLGFNNPPTGLLRQIAIDAQRIAKHISMFAEKRASARDDFQ